MTQTTRQQPQQAMAIIDPRDAPLAMAHFGDRIDQIIEQISRGWKRPMEIAELEHIGLICQRTRLDPLVKPALIYFIQRFDKAANKYVMTAQVSIDGARLSAARSRDYVTQVGPQWCGEDGNWRDIWTSQTPPAAARVGVVRRGTREPLWSVALWQESVQDTAFWRGQPAHMLAKVAEFNALKRACPAETNELELAHLEEMERLEVPARAAEYLRIHGTNDEAFGLAGNPELPAYVAPRARTDLEDLPRSPLTPERQKLVDMYSNLVAQAIRMNVVVGSAEDWMRVLSSGTDADIIEKGRALRALVNKATIKHATAGQAPPRREDEPEIDPGDMGEGPEWGVGDTNSGPATEQAPPAEQPKVEKIGVRHAVAQKHAELIEEAARLEVEFDDLKVGGYPAGGVSKEEVLRKNERLEERIESRKLQLAGARSEDSQQAQAF